MSFQVDATPTTLRVNGILLFDALNNNLPGAGVIEHVTQSFIRKVYLPQERERILRIGSAEERDALNVFFTNVGAIKGELITRYARKRAALEYEQAALQKSQLERLINGVPEVPGVPGVIDPDTGATTPAVPSVPAIPSIPATVVVDGQAVDNPEHLAATAALAELQSVIDAVSNDPADAIRSMIILRGNA